MIALLLVAVAVFYAIFYLMGDLSPIAEAPAFGAEKQHPELADFLKAGSVDLNTAGREELLSLPQVGETLADRILSYRTQNGKFTAWEELLQIEGIGSSTVEAIRSAAYLGN